SLLFLLRHTRTRDRLRLRPLTATLSPRHHLLMIDQIGEKLIRQIPFPIRVKHPVNRHGRIRIPDQVQQVSEGEARPRVIKIAQAVPHAHKVMIQSPWVLINEPHELHHSPVFTPDALPHAFMKPSTSSPSRSSTASADSGAYFSRNATSLPPLPFWSAAATPNGRESSFGRVNSPSNCSSSNESIVYCFLCRRFGALVFFAGLLVLLVIWRWLLECLCARALANVRPWRGRACAKQDPRHGDC